jgi:hypothetical protein
MNNVLLNLGNYSDPKLAAAVYNFFAKKLFGKYSFLNEVSLADVNWKLVNSVKLCLRVVKNLSKHGLQDDAAKLMEEI